MGKRVRAKPGAAAALRASGNGMQMHAIGGIVVRAASPDDLEAIQALEFAAFPGDRLSRRSLRAFIAARIGL